MVYGETNSEFPSTFFRTLNFWTVRGESRKVDLWRLCKARPTWSEHRIERSWTAAETKSTKYDRPDLKPNQVKWTNSVNIWGNWRGVHLPWAELYFISVHKIVLNQPPYGRTEASNNAEWLKWTRSWFESTVKYFSTFLMVISSSRFTFPKKWTETFW